MENSSNLAPIALFVYNRPWHTQQTLEALFHNDLANESHLVIYSDGPKNDASAEEIEQINEVRSIIRMKSWCKTVEIIESSTNKGLANSIIEGVTKIIHQYGKIIVLEDDIVTSIGFLKFMNDALTIYEFDDQVMHISGYIYPIKKRKKLPNTFFLRTTSCWGWGTWSRAWEKFEKNPQKQIGELEKNKLWYEFNLFGSYESFQRQLESNATAEINTWAIFWYTTVFFQKGLSLHPKNSFVQNIGHDGSGIHCISLKEKNPFRWEKLATKSNIKKIQLKINKKHTLYLMDFFKTLYDTKQLTLRDHMYLTRKKIKHYIFNIIKS